MLRAYLASILAVALAGGAQGAPWVIGHRGAGADSDQNPYPENSLPAICAGLDAGADLVEVDVQLDADGVPLLWHDEDAPAPGGGERPLRELRRRQLPDLVGPTGIVAEVPTLRQALALVRRLAPGARKLDLELKVHRPADRPPLVDAVARELRRARMGRQVLVTSFDPIALAVLERALPGVETGLLTTSSREGLAEVERLRAAGRPIEWVLPDRRFQLGEPPPRNFVRQAHAQGVLVGVWTVNRRSHLEAFARLGFDALITDHPERAQALP